MTTESDKKDTNSVSKCQDVFKLRKCLNVSIATLERVSYGKKKDSTTECSKVLLFLIV